MITMQYRWFQGYSLVTGLIGLSILFIYFGDSGSGIQYPLAAIFLFFVAYGSYLSRRWVIPLLYANLLLSLGVFVFLVAVSGWAGSSNSGRLLWPVFILFMLCYFATTFWLIILSRRHREMFSAHSY